MTNVFMIIEFTDGSQEKFELSHSDMRKTNNALIEEKYKGKDWESIRYSKGVLC